MCAFKLAFYLVLLWAASAALAALSDKRLCIDPQCSELIGEGKTLHRYYAIEPGMLSFARDEPVQIYSYGGGNRPELIGVKIRGRRGYVNTDHVVETRHLKSPKLLVDLEAPPVPTTKQPASEMIDGTRIPKDLQDLQEFTTEAPVEGPFELTEPLSQPVEEKEDDDDEHGNKTTAIKYKDVAVNKYKDEQEKEAVEQASPIEIEENAGLSFNDSSAPIEKAAAAPAGVIEVPPLELLNRSSKLVEETPVVSQVPPPAEPRINEAPSSREPHDFPEPTQDAPVVSQVPLLAEPFKSLSELIEDVPRGNEVPSPPEPLKSSPEPIGDTSHELPPLGNSPHNHFLESIGKIPLVSQTPPLPEPLKSSAEPIGDTSHELPPPGPPLEILRAASESTDDGVNQAEPSPQPAAKPFDSSSSELTGEDTLKLVEDEIDQVPPATSETTAAEQEQPPASVIAVQEEEDDIGDATPNTSFDSLEQTVTSYLAGPEIAELTFNASASVESTEAPPSQAAGWLFERLERTADVETCAQGNEAPPLNLLGAFTTDMFLYLSTTALAVLVLIFVWLLLDKWRRAAPLIARINRLEQQLLATSKENEALQSSEPVTQPDNERLSQLNEEKLQLQAQVHALEKELDDSTEMGIELNRIIGEMLQSSDGSEILKENIEQMQKRLQQQQELISRLQEDHLLKETQLQAAQEQLEQVRLELKSHQAAGERQLLLQQELEAQQQKTADVERELRTKSMQYETLKLSVGNPQQVEGSEARAQLQQLQADNRRCAEQLKLARDAHRNCSALVEELQQLRAHCEQTEREKVESCTKLTVLTNYFKEKEERMLKEISHYESLWSAKEGEATTTSQLSRHLQEELQNYKAQNDSLKQEIVNQEVALKSQISLLEKQAHERWVASRQAERKLEESRQEAALLRNRLTLTERSQLRVQSPLLQNGELPLSPDPAQSPPPPLAFLPPPLVGRPFMLPPPAEIGLPPRFIPGMFPGDHRPPPLGRMSSPPPTGGRYSPESTVYSEYERYDRRSPSPTYDSEYGASPPMRSYSPYERDYRRSNGRHLKGAPSSGSDNEVQGRGGRRPQRKV